MLQISAELLAMSSDAAVLIKNGRLVFANAGAYGMLGPDCVVSLLRACSVMILPEYRPVHISASFLWAANAISSGQAPLTE